ncbi:helix-turn-helix domain-containing protein [Parvibaculum sp.]|uniref:TetR/AcrR family transcriptional regulator n=1 Tax=Parvibaculum sp. TaxID=2024848 RepID=UPI002C56C10C|nr:helix-turn-helix domain-containing protein [Parvibaculum sp.]HUD50029.1 helix-turn-helix domain-containing protein [Parvibaculum sp.]
MSAKPEKSRREEYSDATREALLEAGQRLFTTQGYQQTGIEAVAQASRVTRGALYHHFEDKRALFDAVVMRLQAEAAESVLRRAGAESDPWAAMHAGTEAFLDVCMEPSYLRLVIQDGPAVLGAARHREIDAAYPLGLLTTALKALKKAGEIEFDNVDLLASLIAAMECRAALLMAEAKDPAKLKMQALQAIDRTLTAFRRR